MWLLARALCLLVAVAARGSLPRTRALARLPPRSSAWLRVRGGSVASLDDEDEDEDDAAGAAGADDAELSAAEEHERKLWTAAQLQARQARLAALSRQLSAAGLPFDGFEPPEPPAGAKGAPPPVASWECAVSTEDAERSCLLWGSAAAGAKVVAPRTPEAERSGARGDAAVRDDTWITLSALNSMRRDEPEKVNDLWFNQYTVDMAAFTAHAGPLGALVGALLDARPPARYAALAALAALLVAAFARPLSGLALSFSTSSWLWCRYPSWSRVLYCALPVKLFVGRSVALWLGAQVAKVDASARAALVRAENFLLESFTPVTAGEEAGGDDAGEGEAGEEEDDEVEEEEEFGGEDDAEEEDDEGDFDELDDDEDMIDDDE